MFAPAPHHAAYSSDTLLACSMRKNRALVAATAHQWSSSPELFMTRHETYARRSWLRFPKPFRSPDPPLPAPLRSTLRVFCLTVAGPTEVLVTRDLNFIHILDLDGQQRVCACAASRRILIGYPLGLQHSEKRALVAATAHQWSGSPKLFIYIYIYIY